MKPTQSLSGPATRRILQREFQEYGKAEFQRLAAISNGHLYNLRRNPRYRQQRKNYQKTRPSAVAIGERRRPDPGGRPGYLRVDTVHQGDTENGKGVFHINAVDEVTQWEIAASVERISETYLEPVLVTILTQFPFVIHGFHSDNGSEFINQTVAKLLNKLMIEQTKSRPRHSNDNGLAETKNGAIIRKHMGWGHIPAAHAQRIQQFYSAYLNPYLNYHRPCAQADVEVDAKGRVTLEGQGSRRGLLQPLRPGQTTLRFRTLGLQQQCGLKLVFGIPGIFEAEVNLAEQQAGGELPRISFRLASSASRAPAKSPVFSRAWPSSNAAVESSGRTSLASFKCSAARTYSPACSSSSPSCRSAVGDLGSSCRTFSSACRASSVRLSSDAIMAACSKFCSSILSLGSGSCEAVAFAEIAPDWP